MNRIISSMDHRNVNFAADNGRWPNPEERARLFQSDVNNANHPSIQDLQNRIIYQDNEIAQVREENKNLKNQAEKSNKENQDLRNMLDEANASKLVLQNQISKNNEMVQFLQNHVNQNYAVIN